MQQPPKRPRLKRTVTTYTVVSWELDWEGSQSDDGQPDAGAEPAESAMAAGGSVAGEGLVPGPAPLPAPEDPGEHSAADSNRRHQT
jgi:hypothetical protein